MKGTVIPSARACFTSSPAAGLKPPNWMAWIAGVIPLIWVSTELKSAAAALIPWGATTVPPSFLKVELKKEDTP